MGPAATADFYTKLVSLTPGRTDQDHPKVVIWADPTVPDRTLALTEQGRTLLEEAMTARAAIVDDAIADWPASDREALTVLMTRLAASLDRPADDLEAR